MAIICPTVLAREPHEFREQMERVGAFAQRLQLDITDGEFTPLKTIPLDAMWWPRNLAVDVHVMFEQPAEVIDQLIAMRPNMVILHAEAKGSFVEMARKLHSASIKVGIALLPNTGPEGIKPAIEQIDHVLIFSGELGSFGGSADLGLLEKISHIRAMKSDVEIGWDGGVNDTNALQMVEGGVDVLNVGGYIHTAADPARAYRLLVEKVTGKS
jgi:ribulose-phosphate 3-epimerase